MPQPFDVSRADESVASSAGCASSPASIRAAASAGAASPPVAGSSTTREYRSGLRAYTDVRVLGVRILHRFAFELP